MGGPATVDGTRQRCTDNFLIAPTTIDAVVHQSAEHYYQYAKFDQSGAGAARHCEEIRQAPLAPHAWSLGQSRSYPLIAGFEDVKAGLMYRAVRAKFHQHPGLAEELLATRGPIRAAPSTVDWQQVNSLILERVRAELRVERGVAKEPPDNGAWGCSWAALLRRTGGDALFTAQDAAEPTCGGACKECVRARGAVLHAEHDALAPKKPHVAAPVDVGAASGGMALAGD